MLTDLASWLLVAAGATLSTLSLRQLESSWRDLRRLRAHRRAARSAIQKSRMDLLEVRNRAKLLEDTVASGTQAVEKVHQAISSTTFGLIDLFSRDDATRASARRAVATTTASGGISIRQSGPPIEPSTCWRKH